MSSVDNLPRENANTSSNSNLEYPPSNDNTNATYPPSSDPQQTPSQSGTNSTSTSSNFDNTSSTSNTAMKAPQETQPQCPPKTTSSLPNSTQAKSAMGQTTTLARAWARRSRGLRRRYLGKVKKDGELAQVCTSFSISFLRSHVPDRAK